MRIALGADRGAILRDVLGRALRLASIGIVGGAVLAAVAAQGLSTLLLDVSPFDPLTYVVVSLFLIGVCLLASFIPARRATRSIPSSRCGRSDVALPHLLHARRVVVFVSILRGASWLVSTKTRLSSVYM